MEPYAVGPMLWLQYMTAIAVLIMGFMQLSGRPLNRMDFSIPDLLFIFFRNCAHSKGHPSRGIVLR